MDNVKKDIGIFGINCDSMSLHEFGEYEVGDNLRSALSFVDTQMELSQSTTKYIKKLDLNLYEGVGKIINIDDYNNGQMSLFDCGIYAYSFGAVPKRIKSGSYVKMRFYLIFDDGFLWQLTVNGKRLTTVIPDMEHVWEIKDIFVRTGIVERGKQYYEDLPVAWVSPKREIYKRIRKTNARVECGGGHTNNYILFCEMK
ncbi:MAG: hypothetical protein HQK99_06295 [Nitrospirae bacterium]|nr:hypothetical protein [Nitrospirota bacterium]